MGKEQNVITIVEFNCDSIKNRYLNIHIPMFFSVQRIVEIHAVASETQYKSRYLRMNRSRNWAHFYQIIISKTY